MSAEKSDKTVATQKKAAKTTSKVGKAVLSASGKTLAHGVGRRKKSVARVWLKKGSGKVSVNGRPVDVYFDTDINRADAVVPFTLVPEAGKYDAQVNVFGGGVCSQAGAVKLGISRALLDSEDSLRPALRSFGLLTVDSRNKERKKYGQRGARRKFQFVKR